MDTFAKMVTVARYLPGHAEADVGKTHATVDEKNGKTGQREKPVEDHAAVFGQVDECKATKQQLHDHHIDGATLLVNLGQELGCHTYILLALQCA